MRVPTERRREQAEQATQDERNPPRVCGDVLPGKSKTDCSDGSDANQRADGQSGAQESDGKPRPTLGRISATNVRAEGISAPIASP